MLTITTVILFITTILFALMAFAPGAAPVKTPAINRAAETSAEDEIEAVAARFTENLITFDYKTISEDSARTLRDATQQFPSQNQSALPQGTYNAFKQQIVARQTVSTGEVRGAAITSRDDDTATVIVVSRQTSDNKDREQRTRTQVLELTLLKVSGSWKVDKVGTPSTG